MLVRAGFQTRAFEERFINLGLPYRVVGGPRFYERAEIRDAIAYLRLVHQPDNNLALERIINVPKRGLGEATVQLLRRAARDGGVSLGVGRAACAATDELRPKARSPLFGPARRLRALARACHPGAAARARRDRARGVRLRPDVAGGPPMPPVGSRT